MLQQQITKMKANGETLLSGDVAFRLFDTFGFPIEFTTEVASEHGASVDISRYESCLAEHREKSRTTAARSGLADDSQESVRYHTATHLLHAALRQVLGEHVQQKGSNITRERMRFDFVHPVPVSKDEVQEVENLVNEWIGQNMPVAVTTLPYTEAKKTGAIGLFEDRYSNDVTMYSIGDVSTEICAGPHVSYTGEIGKFQIQKEQSSSAGIRRIRAIIS
jgi:alanyl-tRNA synthetase